MSSKPGSSVPPPRATLAPMSGLDTPTTTASNATAWSIPPPTPPVPVPSLSSCLRARILPVWSPPPASSPAPGLEWEPSEEDGCTHEVWLLGAGPRGIEKNWGEDIYNNMSPPPPAEQSTLNLSPGQEGSRELQVCWGAWAHFTLGSGVDCAPAPLSTSHWHHTRLLSGRNVLSFLTYNLPGLRPLSDTLEPSLLSSRIPNKLSSQPGPELPPRPAPPANR